MGILNVPRWLNINYVVCLIFLSICVFIIHIINKKRLEKLNNDFFKENDISEETIEYFQDVQNILNRSNILFLLSIILAQIGIGIFMRFY